MTQVCEVPNCNSVIRSRNAKWCEKHYARMRRYGTLELSRPKLYSLDENAFNHIHPENAWVLGLLWSDGCLIRRSNGVSLTSKDECMLRQVEMVLQGTGLIRARHNPRPHHALYFASRTIRSCLVKHGLTSSKSLTIQWPRGLSERSTWAFIRGLLDGDGCVHLSQKRSRQKAPDLYFFICSASLSLTNSLHDFLIQQGISALHYTEAKGRNNPLHRVEIREQCSLRKLYRKLYPHEDVPRLDRKFKKFHQWYITPRGKAGNPDLIRSLSRHD